MVSKDHCAKILDYLCLDLGQKNIFCKTTLKKEEHFMSRDQNKI
jgi:hypothetical protein